MVGLPAVVRDRGSQENFDALNKRTSAVEGKFPVKAVDLAANAVEAEKVKAGAITDEKLASPIIRGRIAKLGTVVIGLGFTSEKTAAGKYTVKLTTELSTEGIMTVTVCEAATSRYPTIAASGKKEFKIETRNQLNELEDTLFNFWVIKS